MAERRGLHVARSTVSSIQKFLVVEKVAIMFFLKMHDVVY
jgi:hypothetical protein